MSDVTIKYNNETIGEMNESGTATLKTSQKRYVSDIELEYTKSPGITLPTLNLTVPDDFSENGSLQDLPIITDIDGNIILDMPFFGPSGQYQFIPRYEEEKFFVEGYVHALSDIFNVTLNGNNVPYSTKNHGYNFDVDLASYTDTFTLTITNKQ